MMHFNKIETSMWAGMIFTPQFHSIYCLSFRLKHEGMNLIADSFKILKNIEGTNINVPKMKNVLLCTKEYLKRYRNMLQLALEKTLEDFYGSPWQMASQVQNQMTSLMQNYFSIPMYDGGGPYKSLVEAWISEYY